MTTPASSAQKPDDGWPEGGLENVSRCPVCGSKRRRLLHANLRDRVFQNAPGEWNLQSCEDCGSAYLNPRPTPETIGPAYRKYLTHAPGGGVEYAKANWWRRFRIAQRNAYFNANHGYDLKPAAWRPLFLSAARRRRFDSFTGFFRRPGPDARVLDVGCGNGSFLWQMCSLGWEVCGVEPDPQSAANERNAGMDVREGLLQQQSFPENYFDGITMTHVIEHWHDPLDALRRCWKLLKPGGQITVSTPNIGSRGHEVFGVNWFALIPPTHLVLFTENSLRRALESCGFAVSRPLRPSLKAWEIFKASYSLGQAKPNEKRDEHLPFLARLKVKWLATQANLAARQNPALAEELVLLGKKPA